jgi:hypothetical protein
MSIAYSEGVFVALGIQHEMRMRPTRIIIWPVRFNNIFAHYLINSTIFNKTGEGTKNFILFFSANFV